MRSPLTKCMTASMNSNLAEAIQAVVERAPLWLRQDLSSKDAGVRARAEDAMVAMIAEALGRGDSQAQAADGSEHSTE